MKNFFVVVERALTLCLYVSLCPYVCVLDMTIAEETANASVTLQFKGLRAGPSQKLRRIGC